MSSDGVAPLNEDIVCVYASLDSLIIRCGLSKSEAETVKYCMYGYSIEDIAEYKGCARRTLDVFIRRATKKIVRQNNLDWEACYSNASARGKIY